MNTINKPRQFTAKPHNFFMIAGKEKTCGETKEHVAALRWAASWEGTLLFSAPKAPLTSLMSPADMSATMTALPSPATLLNRRNFRHYGFNITRVFGDFSNDSIKRLQQHGENSVPNTAGSAPALKTEAEIRLRGCKFCKLDGFVSSVQVFMKPALNKTAQNFFSPFPPQPLPGLSWGIISIYAVTGYNIFPKAHFEWHGTVYSMRQCLTEENPANLWLKFSKSFILEFFYGQVLRLGSLEHDTVLHMHPIATTLANRQQRCHIGCCRKVSLAHSHSRTSRFAVNSVLP